MGLIERDLDIALTTRWQDPNRLSLYGLYRLSHALHCALVCPLAASRAGWPPERVRRLVRAPLTMSLSIVEVQDRFAAMGRLNHQQRDQVRTHPRAAVDRLQAAGVTEPAWLQAVLEQHEHHEHHERPGGGGCPHNLSKWCEEASVLRMADLFMAKIGSRTERPALPILDAARQLFRNPGQPAGLGDHQGIRYLPAGQLRAAGLWREGGGDPPRRDRTPPGGRGGDRPQRHPGGAHDPAQHRRAGLCDQIAGARQQEDDASAA